MKQYYTIKDVMQRVDATYNEIRHIIRSKNLSVSAPYKTIRILPKDLEVIKDKLKKRDRMTMVLKLEAGRWLINGNKLEDASFLEAKFLNEFIKDIKSNDIWKDW